MKIFKQIALILLFYVLGEGLSLLIVTIIPTIFIPGSILGMVLLLIALYRKILKLVDVDDVGSFLTANMSFFFIPAAVSVLEYFDLIKHVLWQILLIIFIGVFLSFFIVAYSVKLTVHLQEKYNKRKGKNNA